MAYIYYDERPYSDAWCKEPAPMTFREPPYYDDGYHRRRYEEPATITFPEPPYYREPLFYDNGGYFRSDFRDQYPVFNRGGYLLPREQVLVRAEDPPLSSSWWDNPGRYPYGRCIVECPQHVTTVELYAPQLCCDECERRVVDCLDDMAGVESVTVDQWLKKVVVVGRNLCPNDVLRRLQRDPHMNRSLFWHDR